MNTFCIPYWECVYLEGLMKNPAPERPSIASPVLDAPDVDITGVALSAPPSYAKGADKYICRFYHQPAINYLQFYMQEIYEEMW